jgi:hypothetical protein
MEYHDEVPRPSKHMQFGSNPVALSQKSDNTISFGDIADSPISFNQHMQDFSNDQSVTMVNEGGMASHQPLQPSHDSADLQDVSTGSGYSLQGRVCKMSRAMAESVSQQDFYSRDKMHYLASQAMCEHDYDCLHNSHIDLQDCMRHPFVFVTEMMGDIMYLHQALRQPDARGFVEAVTKEVNVHNNNKHWKLIPHTEVPEDTEVVPSVWAMQRK